ncbi:hypothetical protein [Sporosarcina sp. HYO08]|uniref:hypothetical protein n=1 Tax=Sporosarcina sp. HYO08 TaxID=1759557 RepID=UPI00079BA7A8|nr:hypothetical protein [Sporosarcina sp. HYO08]KXH84004.1 hypothetical protein AU377_04425 [Sporosarcina sp. HYO08]
MEKFVLHVMDIDQHFLEIEKYRHLLAAEFDVNSSQDIQFFKKEKELFIQAESDGRKQYDLMMIDFACNRITFKKGKQCSIHINQTAFKILSSLSVKFEPHTMSFLMGPRPKEKDTVK